MAGKPMPRIFGANALRNSAGLSAAQTLVLFAPAARAHDNAVKLRESRAGVAPWRSVRLLLGRLEGGFLWPRKGDPAFIWICLR